MNAPFVFLRNLFAPLLIALTMGGTALPQTATTARTWYVRTDGGGTGLADGLADAACTAGVMHCAFNTPALLVFPGGAASYAPAWKVKPGDTVVIHAGHYPCGYLGPNVNDDRGLAVHGDPYQPCFPKVPANTAWIGDGAASTQIYGQYGAGVVFDVRTSANVSLVGLDVTDHGACSKYGNGDDPIQCVTSYPLSNYANNGIWTGVGTCGLTLRDVRVHGFVNNGIVGPICGTVTVDHVSISFNGGAGWNFDDGSGTASVNTPTLAASYLTVEGNGCNEEYPLSHQFPARSCHDDNDAGYGDGVGTPDTPLNITCDHCTFRYNTQDGLDALHVSGSKISITHSLSYGNMGQQWKLGAMASVLFQNNLTVHNCKRMALPIGDNPGDWWLQSNPDYCRAAGDGLALRLNDGSNYLIENNSFLGYGWTSYDWECSGTCTKPVVTFRNNLNIGYPNPIDGQLPGIHYFGDGLPANIFVEASHNIYFNMRSQPVEPNVSYADPKILAGAKDASLDGVDFHLTSSSSNAIGTAGASTATDDYEGNVRRSPTSIGAYDNIAGGTTVAPQPTPAPSPTPTPAPTSLSCSLNITLATGAVSGKCK